MSSWTADLALDALLADLRPPPVPAGLAERVAAAALALPQESASAPPSRPRHARRWLRRPLLAGGVALGIAFTGAVAASIAGVELPRPVAAVIEKLPLIGKAAPEAEPASPPAPRGATPQPVRPPATPAAEAPPEASPEAPPPALPPRLERRVERLERAQEIVAERRAAGLPTPRADRIERMLERRRAAGLPTPRADRIERVLEQRRAARSAGALPPVPEAPVETPSDRLRRWIEAQRARRDAAGQPVPPPSPQPVPQRVEPSVASPVPDQPQTAPNRHLQDAASDEQRRAWLRQQQILRLQRLERLRRAQDRRAAIRRASPQRLILRPTPRN